MEPRDRLLAFFRSRVATREDAEDLAHDVLLRAHERRGSLSDASRFDAWLFAIARNALTDHYRRKGRALPASEDSSPSSSDEGSDAYAELAACVRPFLRRLKDEDRDALTRVDLEGETQVQAARALGLSVSGMKSRVQRARRRLLEELLACCEVEVDARRRPMGVDARRCGCQPLSNSRADSSRCSRSHGGA